MRVLIDECLPRALKGYISEHECATVQQMNWAGKKNGELLAAADSQFDVLLTIDGGMQYQQNLTGRHIAIVVISARSNQLEDLLPMMAEVASAIKDVRSGQVLRIE